MLINVNCDPQKALKGGLFLSAAKKRHSNVIRGIGYHPDLATDWWSERVMRVYAIIAV